MSRSTRLARRAGRRGFPLARARTFVLVLTLVGAVAANGVAAAKTPTATRQPDTIARSSGVKHYAVDEPVCARPANPNLPRCFAVKRVPVAKGTRNAFSYTVPNTLTVGPAGGYTPADLATAYNYNPNVDRRTQLVGIVDWYDDPDALSDLNTFDRTYGLHTETSTSFRKVNQRGKTAPLPARSQDSSGEIALDVESVRAVCHTCRILLVEANAGTDANLAAAENLAVRMGATEISNSFGESEHRVSASVLAAYNHPGVVITASSGDDGWYAWDGFNDGGASGNAAEFPSTSPDVVAVGGTTLSVTNSDTFEEDVWNENGADDEVGLVNGHEGAGGGGCSTLYAAPAWQLHFPGYAAAGCRGKRLVADVSAIADPQWGFDILDSYNGGWGTYGGTSLASPVVAALYALAGGAGGSAYPAASLYVNGSVRKSGFHDVVAGGNGFCAGDTTLNCGDAAGSLPNSGTYNPNALGAGLLDCSFPRSLVDVSVPPPMSSECNAVPGYDGPSGIGSPRSDAIFLATNPVVTIKHPAKAQRKKKATLRAKLRERVSSTHGVTYRWNFGDGHTKVTRKATVKHAYARTGRFTIRLTEVDNRSQLVLTTAKIKIVKPPKKKKKKKKKKK